MNDAKLRTAIVEVLRSLDAETELAIRRELARVVDLGHSGRLQFEACPNFLGISLVQTEEEILADSSIDDRIPPELRDAAAAADLSVHDAIEAELPAWFADRWRGADGPLRYRPAYLFFHGGLDTPRYDLEERRWCDVTEVWPEE